MYHIIQNLLGFIRCNWSTRNQPAYIHKARQIAYLLVGLCVSPIQLTTFLIVSIALFNIYKLINMIKCKQSSSENYFWKTPMRYFSLVLSVISKYWNGHDILGLENIPETSGALLVIFHAPLPLDFFYLGAKLILNGERELNIIADKSFFNVFGMSDNTNRAWNMTPGTIDSCVSLLRRGQLLLVSPGGIREALFSNNYELLWNERIGFARIAKEAQVPILPVFTENGQQITYIPGLRKFFRWIYEKTHIAFIPAFGWWPVKLRTHIGKPVTYDASMQPREIYKQVQSSMRDLISEHQKFPDTLLGALMDRLR